MAVAETKKTKYDRQLRIWGEQGQSALENANICLLNCGPTGSEALKNLVLGGIGSITVDGSKVEIYDLGNNFLLDEDSLGQSKAKCVCSFLQELNDAVKAKFVEEAPEHLIEKNPSFFAEFPLVIATQLPRLHSYTTGLKQSSVPVWMTRSMLMLNTSLVMFDHMHHAE
ncbi:NEDD8-activating enzyme E1 regulatory subunit AXR1 [Canna indica]|uniref:NEDD8-activating enzyme E1 regulatory subunit AXR1 n=1 Tax=Canna indica TaxID=4628 RepID=A0AAQ3K0X8_9LILI|nr:NEDD8-activating enzyme E1 regulatory subunit AXR1 [Canna indica]